MKQILCLFSLLVGCVDFFVSAQQPFAIRIQPSSITAVVPTHSGAFADWNGKWIFIGGRRDGLHIMQANLAFPVYNANDSVYVVDPVANTYQSAGVSVLPPDIYQAITSSNMEYYQDRNYLYMIGGYGKHTVQNDWMTFPSLISIDLNCLLSAVASSSSLTSCFRQLIDTNMAVTGGMLEKIDSTYYLTFGHRFDGRYMVPMGGMAMFTQTYTEQIRKFNIHDDGINLSIANYTTVTDTDNFHRRDLNLQPQIFPDGEYGMTAFGGVFQKHADLPFLSPIDIKSGSYQLQSSFNQNLNQYTSASLPVYDSLNNFMHTLFFGGLSLYTLDTATHAFIQDTLVPFVRTISKISRDSSGNLTEYKLPVEMPGLLGANATFIPDPAAPLAYGRIIRLNALSGVTRVGYIVGGIQSDFPNVGNLDPESMSRPNAQVYEVFIDRTLSAVDELPIHNRINNLKVYPNPAHDILYIDFSLPAESDIEISLYSSGGQVLHFTPSNQKSTGDQHLTLDVSPLKSGTYFCKVKAGDSLKIVKVVLD